MATHENFNEVNVLVKNFIEDTDATSDTASMWAIWIEQFQRGEDWADSDDFSTLPLECIYWVRPEDVEIARRIMVILSKED